MPPVMLTCPQYHCATRKFEAPTFLETLHKVVLWHKSCVAAGRGNRGWSFYLMGALCFGLFTKCNVAKLGRIIGRGMQYSLPAENAFKSLIGKPESKAEIA
jgi:hypothetical protein